MPRHKLIPALSRFSTSTTRDRDAILFEPEQQVWAVAYADLLMVLLSFFTLFYSASTNTKGRGLLELAISMKGQVGAAGGSTASAAASTNATGLKRTAADAMFDLSDRLKPFSVESKWQGTSLALHFPDDSFKAGSHSIEKELDQELTEVQAALGPHIDRLEFVVIGHADRKPLVPRNAYVRDNFDLSTQRALSAMRRLQALGLPRERLMIQGAADNDRAQRSLTLMIRLRKDSE